MFPNNRGPNKGGPNNGGADNSRRKMKEVMPEATMPPPTATGYSLQHVSEALRQEQRAPPPPPPPLQQDLLISFTSLLNDDRTAELVEKSDEMEQIIQNHSNQLRRTLVDKWQGQYRTLVCAAEEKAEKKLKEREVERERLVRRNRELEQMVAHYRMEGQIWYRKAKQFEEAAGTSAVEDGDSSYVDPDKVDPVSLPCKVCGKQVATTMMWPCRHLCFCKRCDVVSMACPVCSAVKTNSVEVRFS